MQAEASHFSYRRLFTTKSNGKKSFYPKSTKDLSDSTLLGRNFCDAVARQVRFLLYSPSFLDALTCAAEPLQVQHSFDQDRELFMIGWKPVVSAISYAFTNFNDDAVLQKALVGFQQVAELASRFDFPDVFDHIIFALARITGLSPGPANVDTSTFPKVEVPVKGSDQQQEIIISPLSVRFGTNVKAQLAAVVLFAIANNHSASIRKGWIHIIEVYQTLFIHSLLPASLLSMEDFLAGTSVIPLKAREAPSTRPDARTDGGLLSALSSYLLSPQANVGSEGLGSEMTEDDIDDTLSTVDCISSCRLEELYAGIL